MTRRRNSLRALEATDMTHHPLKLSIPRKQLARAPVLDDLLACFRFPRNGSEGTGLPLVED